MRGIDYKRAYHKFWMGFEVSTTKLRVFRFAFFAVFALDAWLQIAHAPRYGANDFNVSHFPWLDFLFPTPTRSMMVVVFGLQAYLGLRLAFGRVSRAAYIALAALFAFGYYVSQLNSLQHHYLMSMALGLMAVFPWPDLRKTSTSKKDFAREARKQRESNWPVRMLLVSLSIMYFFAVITKLDPLWLDGSTLKMELSSDWLRSLCETLGWGSIATLTLLVELALVVLLHVRRLWPAALVLGLGMHMSFEHSGLNIGLFSYFMVTLYILVLPEAWLKKASDTVGPLLSPILTMLEKADKRRLLPWLAFAAALAMGVGLLSLLPLSSINTLTALIALVAIADLGISRRGASAGLAHLVAMLAFLFFLHTTGTLRDYYRFWGGQERRSGNISAAIIAYEDLVRYEPSYASGRRRLGDLYRQTKRNDEAIEQYEAGLAVDPKHFALNKGAAQLFHLLGKGEEALLCAERALESKGNDQAARRIRDHWRKQLDDNAPRP